MENNTPIPTSKKPSKALWITLIATSASILCIALIVVLFITSSPTYRVNKSFRRLANDLNNTQMNQILGSTAINEQMQEKGGEIHASFTLDSSDIDALSSIVDSGLDLQYMIDQKQQLMNLGVTGTYGGASMLSANMLFDDTSLYVTCPALYKGYITCKSDNIYAQYNDSDWGAEDPIDCDNGEELSLNPFADSPDSTKLWEAFVTEYAEDIHDCKDSILIEQTKDRASIKIEGKTLPCKGYQVIIPEKSIELLFEDYCEFLQSDTFLEFYSSSAANSLSAEDKEELADTLDELVDSFSNMIDDDLEYMLYLDSSGNLRRFEIVDQPLVVDDLPLSIDACIDFTGKSRPIDSFEGEIVTTLNGNSVKILLDKSNSQEGNLVDSDFTAKLRAQGSTIATLSSYSCYNLKTQEFSSRIKLKESDDSIDLETEGRFTDCNKGKSYTMEFDSISLHYGEKNICTFSGEYSIGKIQDTDALNVPSGPKYSIFDMDISGKEDLEDEIQSNITELEDTLWNVFE